MRYRKLLVAFMMVFSLAVPLVVAGSSSAELFQNSKDQACQGLGGCGDKADSELKDKISAILNFLTVLVGVFAVIMIMVSGAKFIGAKDDPAKLKTARGTLTSALIGFVVVALAQFMVFFVLNKTKSTALPACPTGQSTTTDGKACQKP